MLADERFDGGAGLGFAAAHRDEEGSQVFSHRFCARMVPTKQSDNDRERAPIQRLGLGDAVRVGEQQGELSRSAGISG